MLQKDMQAPQLRAAQQLMQNNLANHQDWIVLNQTMDTLTQWAKKDEVLKAWLKPHLERLKTDTRKSVAGRAQKMLDKLQG